MHKLFYVALMEKLPSPEKNKFSMPESFADISNCRVIIERTKFQIQTPRKDLRAAGASYSNYKHKLFAKYLIGVAPNGAITFVSKGYHGSTYDKVVTDQSGVITNVKVRTKRIVSLF